MSKLKKIITLHQKCSRAEASLTIVTFLFVWYKIKGKQILSTYSSRIKGLDNIITNGYLQIDLIGAGFSHKYDRSFIHIKGELIVNKSFQIGKGCRIYVGENAKIILGSGYITAQTKLLIENGLQIGENCAISWGCEFVDSDYHFIDYDGRSQKDPKIIIGNHVWVGSNVTVLKGVQIPDGCVIASGSVVNKIFTKKNCLIAGNPAKVIKEDITWK